MKQCPFCRKRFESGAYCPSCATFVPDEPGTGGTAAGYQPWSPSPDAAPAPRPTPGPGSVPGAGDAVPGSQHLYAPGAPLGPGGSGWIPPGPGSQPTPPPTWDRFGPAGPYARGGSSDMPWDPSMSGCRTCGAGPAATVTFTQNIGMVLMRKSLTTRGTFCRDCGLATGRAVQHKTLVTGWWGLISFFMNIMNLFNNAAALRRLGRLQPPQGGEPSFRKDPGVPVFLRPGILVPVALVAFFAWSLLGSASTPKKTATVPPSYAVGTCVQYDGPDVRVTSCSGSHSGKIISHALTDDDCPEQTLSYIPSTSGVWCVDETQ